MLDNYLTVKEVAEKLKVSEQLLYKMIRNNNFPYKKIGSRVIIPEKELAAFLN